MTFYGFNIEDFYCICKICKSENINVSLNRVYKDSGQCGGIRLIIKCIDCKNTFYHDI
jgi:hypothetical protein